MAESAARLRPLCRVDYELGEPIAVSSGPAGSVTVGEITAARFDGDRLQASLKGRAAADWATVEPDGRVRVDARLTVETDDGAVILVTYLGRMNARTGIVYSSMYFETGDDRYEWLTWMLAVAKGSVTGRSLTYDVFEVV